MPTAHWAGKEYRMKRFFLILLIVLPSVLYSQEYEILKEATIKTGSTTINLAQRDMIGIKCTMRMAYLVADDKAFSMVTSA